MMKQSKPVGMMLMVLVLVLAFSLSVFGGDLEPAAGPDDAGSAMYTIEDAYNRLYVGEAGAKRSGGFTEPSSAPGSTGVTLDQVMEMMPAEDDTDGALPEDVAAGRTYWSLRTDGTWGQQEGITWPDPRFTDNGDGTVTDNLTGLIWLQDANRNGSTMIWADALTFCNSLADDGTELTDGSVAGQWRLPNVKELQSLIDFGRYNPALPTAHQFSNVQSDHYWSSSTRAGYPVNAWFVYMAVGSLYNGNKTDNRYVWPVRSDN
jgi:hypothetical protein